MQHSTARFLDLPRTMKSLAHATLPVRVLQPALAGVEQSHIVFSKPIEEQLFELEERQGTLAARDLINIEVKLASMEDIRHEYQAGMLGGNSIFGACMIWFMG